MKKNILIIEDDTNIQELLKYNLETDGYNSHSSDNWENAKKILKRNKIDMILLDLMLPDINGLDICKNLKKSDNYSDIPIVMITAKSSESDIVTGLELGADDYVTKPFSLNVLKARIRRLIKRKEVENNKTFIKTKNFIVNTEEYKVSANNKVFDLTITEYSILLLLLKTPL